MSLALSQREEVILYVSTFKRKRFVVCLLLLTRFYVALTNVHMFYIYWAKLYDASQNKRHQYAVTLRLEIVVVCFNGFITIISGEREHPLTED